MPPSLYQALLMWLESIRMSHGLRRGLAASVLALSLLALVPLVLNAGPTPALLGRALVRLAERQGVTIEIEQVRIAGAGRIVLEGVELNPHASSGVDGRLSIPRAVVWVDTGALLKGEIHFEKLISRATLIDPHIELAVTHLPLPMLATPDSKEDGGLPLGGDSSAPPAAKSSPVRITATGGTLLAVGEGVNVAAAFDFDVEWQGRHLRVDALHIGLEDGPITGHTDSQGEVALTPTGVAWEGETHLRDAAFWLGSDVYRVAEAHVASRYQGGILSIVQAMARTEAGAVEIQGEMTGTGALNLHLRAAELDLAEDLPFLARLGFDGPGAFEGTLTGELTDFVLAGRAATGPGAFWGREGVTGAGDLVVTKEALRFTNARLYQHAARYDLAGEYRFARPEVPGYLEIGVDSSLGKIEELLALVGLDAPLSGRLDGQLRFVGDLGAVGAQGEVVLHAVQAADQPLDRVEGAFTWSAGELLVCDVVAALGAGLARVEGRAAADGAWMDLRFEATDWPLAMTSAVDSAWGQVLGGSVSVVAGWVEGSVEQPRVGGDLLAEMLRLGPTHFHDVAGRFEFAADALHIEGLQAQRSDGGAYTLAGRLAPFAQVPTADLSLHVQGERLRGLLQLAGQELPAALLDGVVDGKITMQGAIEDPQVELDLVWGDTFGAGRALDLKLAVDGGELRIDHVRLTDKARQLTADAADGHV